MPTTCMSMTGYGHGEVSSSGLRVTVELRSVNHRFLDLQIKLPRAWAALDGRDTVTNADLNSVLFPAIRHRLGLSVHAQAEGLTPDEVLQKILDSIDDRAEQTNSGKTTDNNIFRRWLGRLAETTPPFRKKS